MINERFWNALGAGGILVTDWVNQMGMFFEESELITAHTKEEFQEKCLYYLDHRAEGLKKLEKARARVRELHTYNQRIKVLC
jgi:spore maturation protein CgeB